MSRVDSLSLELVQLGDLARIVRCQTVWLQALSEC